MRVLLISPVYNGSGAARCARDLFDALPSQGIKTQMLVGRRDPGDPAGVSGARLPGEKYLRLMEFVRKPMFHRYPGSALALRRIGAGDVDLVHLHNLAGGWLSLPAVRSLCQRVPTVWTLHDEWATTGGLPYDLSRVMKPPEIDQRFGTKHLLHPGTTEARRTQAFVRRRLPQPRALICPSRYLSDLVRSNGTFAGTAIYQLKYGMALLDRGESRMAKDEARRRFNLPPDGSVILIAAAYLDSPYKGAWLAIEALRKMPAGDIRVLVVGHGAEALSARIPQTVTATGFLSDPGALAAAYRAADVTVLPSVADNFPYMALESMACGTPLVAFKVGGMPEMLGENERGLLADALDPGSLREAILRLLQSPELANRLGSAGHEWVQSHCRMEDFLCGTRRIYDDVIAGRALRPPADPLDQPPVSRSHADRTP